MRLRRHNLTGGCIIWTTRCIRILEKGVVDEQSRVHGISNLFIAGPGPPAVMLTRLDSYAMTLRLADHVKKFWRELLEDADPRGEWS